VQLTDLTDGRVREVLTQLPAHSEEKVIGVLVADGDQRVHQAGIRVDDRRRASHPHLGYRPTLGTEPTLCRQPFPQCLEQPGDQLLRLDSRHGVSPSSPWAVI
jgi:hypothetical protein